MTSDKNDVKILKVRLTIIHFAIVANRTQHKAKSKPKHQVDSPKSP